MDQSNRTSILKLMKILFAASWNRTGKTGDFQFVKIDCEIACVWSALKHQVSKLRDESRKWEDIGILNILRGRGGGGG